ncbi:Protoheme IX farnesyltransferase, mitochondrial [Lecanora helva]
MPLSATCLRPNVARINFICKRCLARVSRVEPLSRQFSASTSRKEVAVADPRLGRLIQREYFSANGSLGQNDNHPTGSTESSEGPKPIFLRPRKELLQGLQPQNGIPSEVDSATTEPPHRRRKRLKDEARTDSTLPLDASSRLSTISAAMPTTSLRRLLTTCLSLSKPRLSFLIVLTTATAYSLYPVPTLLLPTTTTSPSLSALTLVFLASGTAMCSASANALNMLFEPKYDAMMSRTRNRPLVRGLIGKKGATLFAIATGIMGVGSLWFGVNPTVSFLGALNIFLYAGVYTPMKRISVMNTWVGAIVGGIPPLMGWAAAAGQSATGTGEWRELLFGDESIGGWLLASLLFAWQFPHFNSLSWPIREEYKNAGYRMLVWTNTRMNGRVAFRYALLCFPICVGLWWCQITDQGFLITSSIVNGWMVKEAWKFWRKEGQRGSARGLFWASVWHLPVVMVLAMIHKKGLWEGIWSRLNGGQEEEDEWMEDFEQPARENRRFGHVAGSLAPMQALTKA